MIQESEVSQATQQSCSNCGASFTCGALAGNETCWCHDLPHITPPTTNVDDCLCPNCLAEAIAKVSATQK